MVMCLGGLSRNSLVAGLTSLSIAFIPFHSEPLNALKVKCLILALIIYSFGALLTAHALSNERLVKYAKALLMQTIALLTLLIISKVSAIHQIYTLTQVVTAVTMANFLILHTSIWRLFKRTFISVNKFSFNMVFSIFTIVLAVSAYLIPLIILSLAGIKTYEYLEIHLRNYQLISLVMFPTSLTVSFIYMLLPEF
ncbi:MAG: hypothetical protein RMH77_03255 [Sulfolobales archaeon]|nr:hypothetical protein [Sulfolobales archaeon]